MNVSRQDIVEGRMERLLDEAERLGFFSRMPAKDREESLRATLAKLPPEKDVWLFGYGSLMWNPAIHTVDRQAGRLFGYHRQFCLWTMMGRGTPDRPGLMLALQPGGSCHGIVYRVAADAVEHELEIVWKREMVSGAYVPKIVNIQTASGKVRAIAFVINKRHERYAGHLPTETIVQSISQAEGPIGRCCDYLFSTVEHLDALGIGDGPMHELCREVRARQGEQRGRAQ